MRFEDLSPEDQKIATMDFPAEMEKEAMDKIAMTQELYQTGMNKLAMETAKEMDEADEAEKKEESEKPENKLDEGEKKEAAARGAFIARGYIDGLRKEGAANHGDEFHYLYPFIAEKVAMRMPNFKGGKDKVMEFLRAQGSKGMGHARAAGTKAKALGAKGKEKATAAAKATQKHLKDNQGKYYAGAGGAAAGAGAGYMAGKK